MKPNFSQAQSQDLSILLGTWVNQQESILKITDVDRETGQITGIYASAEGDDDQRSLLGFANTKAPDADKDRNVIVLAFSVQWGEHGSVTTWAGRLEMPADRLEIHTQWHLVRPNADYEWEHVHAGSSIFIKEKD